MKLLHLLLALSTALPTYASDNGWRRWLCCSRTDPVLRAQIEAFKAQKLEEFRLQQPGTIATNMYAPLARVLTFHGLLQSPQKNITTLIASHKPEWYIPGTADLTALPSQVEAWVTKTLLAPTQHEDDNHNEYRAAYVHETLTHTARKALGNTDLDQFHALCDNMFRWNHITEPTELTAAITGWTKDFTQDGLEGVPTSGRTDKLTKSRAASTAQ